MSGSIRRILVAGYGTMAGAMVEGWLRAGIPADSFTIYNPRPKPVPEGVRFTSQWPAGGFDAIVLGMKPHHLAEVAGPINAACDDGTIILSVLAGIELDTLAQAIPSAGAWVRFMPNLAVAIGKSPNALIGKGLPVAQEAGVTALAEALGTAEWLADESLFDLVTALAGSGPGFVYRVIDALAAAAQALGLDAAQAERLAVQMVDGAGSLAAQSDLSPGELAARVASPGGMTQAGLDVLDAGDALVRLFTETLRKTRDRGAEMAAEARKKG